MRDVVSIHRDFIKSRNNGNELRSPTSPRELKRNFSERMRQGPTLFLSLPRPFSSSRCTAASTVGVLLPRRFLERWYQNSARWGANSRAQMRKHAHPRGRDRAPNCKVERRKKVEFFDLLKVIVRSKRLKCQRHVGLVQLVRRTLGAQMGIVIGGSRFFLAYEIGR